MTWTAAVGGEVCGGCDLSFRENQPIALLTTRLLKRCELCVAPAEVDWAAVDAVLAAREAARAKDAVSANIAFKGGAPVLAGFSDPPAAMAPASTGRGADVRLPAPKPVLPFAKIADTLPPSFDNLHD